MLKNLDLSLGLGAIPVALLLGAAGLQINNFRLQQVALVLFLAAALYLIGRQRFPKLSDLTALARPSRTIFLSLNIAFFGLFILCIYLLNQNLYVRPLSFLIIVSVMAGLLGMEIMTAVNKKQHYLILGETMVLGILISASLFFQYPSMIGGDPWEHASWIEQLANFGYISSFMRSYQYFPMMHIFVVIVSALSSFNTKDSMFLLGICESISLIFIYLIVRKIFNEKIGLLSVLLLTLSKFHILWSFNIIPQTFGICFIPMLLFLIFTKESSADKILIYKLIVFLLLVIVTLTHSITSYAILISIVSILIIRIFIVKIRHALRPSEIEYVINGFFSMFIFFLILLIAYWLQTSGFSDYIIMSTISGFSVSYQAPSAVSVSEDFITMGMRWLPVYASMFCAIIGSLYALNNKKHLISMLYGWGVVAFIFASTFLNLTAFLPGRWFIFMDYAILAPAVIALVIIYKIMPAKLLALFAIVFVFSFIMVTNYEANVTNINPYSPYPTQALKSSEMTAAKTVMDNTGIDASIYSDTYYLTYVSINDASAIFAGDQTLNGILLIRKEIENNVFFSSYGATGHYNMVKPLTNFSESQYIKIYDCGTVTAILG